MLYSALEPLPLSRLLTSRTIQGPHVIREGKAHKRVYTLEMTVAVPEAVKSVNLDRVLRCLQRQFIPILMQLIARNASKSGAAKKMDIEKDAETKNKEDDAYNVQESGLSRVTSDSCHDLEVIKLVTYLLSY